MIKELILKLWYRLVMKLYYRFEKIVSYEWQHDETGYICRLPFWKKPGRRYCRINRKKNLGEIK